MCPVHSQLIRSLTISWLEWTWMGPREINLGLDSPNSNMPIPKDSQSSHHPKRVIYLIYWAEMTDRSRRRKSHSIQWQS